MNPKSSRRSFIGAAAGVGVATGALTLPRFGMSATPPGEEDLKLGVATYSFREFSRGLAISNTKKLHVKYVSIKDFHLAMNSTPDEISKARKDFEKAGLTILSGGNISFRKDSDDDIRKNFEYAKAAGMPTIVCAPSHEVLPKMEKYAKEYNIKIAVHNHGPEDAGFFPTPQSVLEMVKNMDPLMGLCIDVGHTARTGVDVVESIRLAGPRLHDMHIKDLANFTDKASQVPVGDGKMPVVAIFKELKKMNYKGGVMLEYEIEADNPLPGMQKSFSYMRGVLDGMKG